MSLAFFFGVGFGPRRGGVDGDGVARHRRHVAVTVVELGVDRLGAITAGQRPRCRDGVLLVGREGDAVVAEPHLVTPLAGAGSVAERFSVTFVLVVDAAPPLTLTIPAGTWVSAQVKSSHQPPRPRSVAARRRGEQLPLPLALRPSKTANTAESGRSRGRVGEAHDAVVVEGLVGAADDRRITSGSVTWRLVVKGDVTPVERGGDLRRRRGGRTAGRRDRRAAGGGRRAASR